MCNGVLKELAQPSSALLEIPAHDGDKIFGLPRALGLRTYIASALKQRSGGTLRGQQFGIALKASLIAGINTPRD